MQTMMQFLGSLLSRLDADAPCQIQNQDIATDFCGYLTREKNGIPIGPKAGSNWLCIYPQGIEELLLYTKKMFNNPVIYIMENGIDELNNGTKSLQDNMRIDFHIQHLEHVHNAMLNGVNVMGYFTWSLLDNFEWAEGYTVRFGVVYVDFEDGLKRYLKDSAKWFKRFLTQEIESE
ncbi:putative Beta-glucosidase [Quillaja saponaria]|uniref:Beta-glucosidase n=1 Tax=Quillaja saponaria TaxID=32244 RepID=A0AAD7VNL4_QUISA|nr:putative Beta-glucosidase [Quillaja saponaria]